MTDHILQSEARAGSAYWFGVATVAIGAFWSDESFRQYPGGYWLGAALMALGIALICLGLSKKYGWRRATYFAFALASCGFAAIQIEGWLELRGDGSVPFISIPLSGLLQLWGVNASGSWGGEVLIEANGGLLRVLPSLQLFGGRTVAIVLAALCLSLNGGQERGLREAILSMLVLWGLLFARIALLTIEYAHSPSPSSSTHPQAMDLFGESWSLVIALLAWAGLSSTLRIQPPRIGESAKPMELRTVGGVVLLGIAAGGYLGFGSIGVPGAGRVLIDDRLSGQWEPASRLLTHDRFGDFSTYSFAAVTEAASNRFAVSVNRGRPYLGALLADYDVLVLKIPEEPLSVEERDDIRDWVRAGGGLFVIGDHTDLMGSSGILNEVIQGSGIRFNFDATGNAESGGFDYWYSEFDRPHAVTRGLKEMELMTPCSLTVSGRAKPIMTLHQSYSREGDYSGNSNFGARAASPRVRQGRQIICAGAAFGRGRVLAFSDSTVFSSFAAHTWGHGSLFLQGIAWLNYSTDRREQLFAYGLFAGLLLAGVWLTWARPISHLLVALGMCTALASDWAVVAIQEAAGGLPPVADAAVRVGVLAEGGAAWLPAVLGRPPAVPEGGHFSTLAMYPQRLGCEVEVIKQAPGELDELEGLIVLNPDRDARGPGRNGKAWLDAVAHWVHAGGKLVVFAPAEHSGHEHEVSRSYMFADSFERLPGYEPFVQVEVGRYGHGVVLRVVGSEQFNADGLGHCMSLPTSSQVAAYSVLYRLFQDELSLAPTDRRTYRILE